MSEQRMQAITAIDERPDTGSTAAGDAELLRRFLDERDAAAMTTIIERHGPLVMGLCRGILRNEQDAADAFQTTFLVLLKNSASIGKPASLSSWLHGVACRVALRARSQAARRRERESAGATMALSELANVDDPADAETLRLIHEELGSLPERLRLPLILCCVEGASREEAARQLGWSLGSLKGRLERARDMLHKRLTRRGVVLSLAALTGVLAGQGAVKVPAALAASTVNSLMLVAAGKSILGGVVSANAAALTTGVLLSMKVAKVKIAAVIAVALLLTAGTSVVVVQTVKGMIAARQRPVPGAGVALVQHPVVVPVVDSVVQQGTAEARDLGPEMQKARMDLQQLLLAMHEYHDKHNTFPFPSKKSADGTPLLSWRVELLPFLDQDELYSQFQHDEPWDSPHNRPLVEKMPDVFACGPALTTPGHTYFQVFVGPGTVFHNGATRSIPQITDGTSNTILIADGATAVPWTKPEEIMYVPGQNLTRLGGVVPGYFLTGIADGSVRLEEKAGFREEWLDVMITAAAGDLVQR